VKNVLEMLREEFELAMSLAGCTKISDIKRGLVETDKDRIRLALTGSTGGIRTPMPRFSRAHGHTEHTLLLTDHGLDGMGRMLREQPMLLPSVTLL